MWVVVGVNPTTTGADGTDSSAGGVYNGLVASAQIPLFGLMGDSCTSASGAVSLRNPACSLDPAAPDAAAQEATASTPVSRTRNDESAINASSVSAVVLPSLYSSVTWTNDDDDDDDDGGAHASRSSMLAQSPTPRVLRIVGTWRAFSLDLDEQYESACNVSEADLQVGS